MRRSKTQNIISLFLLLILLFFASITYFAFHVNSKKKDIFIQSNQNQVEKSIDITLNFETSRIHQVSFDYSFWDEMVSFTSNKNPAWAKINIDPIITTFKVSSASVYDTLGRKIYSVAGEINNSLNNDNFKSEIFSLLNSSRFIQFYNETPSGIVEVFGATIHPSNDPNRLTKPQGYLFISRIIDSNYIKTLSEITGTEISLIDDTTQIEALSHQIVINKPLTLYNSKVIKYLHFEKDIPFIDQYNKFSKELLGLFYLAAIVFIIAFLFVTSRWINRPLRIVEDALTTNDVAKAKSLNRFGREFVEIGDLIIAFISQKRSLELLKNRAEESDRLKSAFMANMSHEIRTPLNGIVGFSELLCRTDPSDETADSYRKIIKNCSNDLMKLINDILDYSRIEAGQLNLFRNTLNVETLINELSNHYENKSEILLQKGVELSFKKSKGDVEIITDKQRLKQVLINLINNAIKFTEKGEIEVNYLVVEDQLILSVKDTGIGISEAQQQIIFERFWQAAQPKSKLYGGTGLGLALSKGLVDLLGGTIRVESEVGVGSTFFVELKLNKQNNAEPSASMATHKI